MEFVCGQRALLPRWLLFTRSALVARHKFHSAIVLQDGGDVADWRSLAGVVEICRPVNNPPPAD